MYLFSSSAILFCWFYCFPGLISVNCMRVPFFAMSTYFGNGVVLYSCHYNTWTYQESTFHEHVQTQHPHKKFVCTATLHCKYTKPTKTVWADWKLDFYLPNAIKTAIVALKTEQCGSKS